ncbi:hypothetical protein [uncultured Nostoc sp.]|uniref:hypothetical protein n=1 Tax=uncultured Nostoc sp. TaxID=340711 RepID=UPI0035C9446E
MHTAAMTTSAWSPLCKSLLCDRSIVSFVSNIGGWIEDTAGAWLISSQLKVDQFWSS